jgi:uncharacterized protein (TIGR00159 family)
VWDEILRTLATRSASQYTRDIADVLLVAFVVYRALLVIRGTRAERMGLGVLVLGGIYALAKYTGLVTLLNLMSNMLTNIVILVVVVFQNDIRRGLMRVGDRAWLPGLSRAMETRVVDEVVAAATELARHRIGALIAFEQDANLDEFLSGHGTPVDASVSRELLVTIFQPEATNKLHDGSVIIRNFRLATAGVFFPMPEARNIDPSLGSRHRAAFGITEETDAVVVAVSEERGTISVFYNGNIIQSLDGQRLKAVLLDLLGHRPKGRKPEPKARIAETRREPQAPVSRPPASMAPPSRMPSSNRSTAPASAPRPPLLMPGPSDATPRPADGHGEE